MEVADEAGHQKLDKDYWSGSGIMLHSMLGT